jgi:hypothetical protein
MGFGKQTWDRSVPTAFVDNRLILNVLCAYCETKINLVIHSEDGKGTTYFNVLRVSCRNFTPGARLHINRPTDEPPSASCRIRVNFELRYGMRDWV